MIGVIVFILGIFIIDFCKIYVIFVLTINKKVIMNIAELIEALKKIKEKHGNINVVTYNKNMECLSPIVKDVKFVANADEERKLFYDKIQIYDEHPTCVIVC